MCHLNLHKTFAIPHGGGGPGMGPIGVAKHLAPFLPGHPLAKVGGEHAIPPVSAAPWGSASILLISYGYIRMLGGEGMTDATRLRDPQRQLHQVAAREALSTVLYTRENGRVAHEMIFDLRAFKAKGVEEGDVAKRLMDYGFHAPTVSFPVAGTLMIEPTESEPKAELDRFCDALIAIRQEIEEVVDRQGRSEGQRAEERAAHRGGGHRRRLDASYSREKAAFPLPWVKANKFWPARGTHRQSIRRPQPDVRVPADGSLRLARQRPAPELHQQLRRRRTGNPGSDDVVAPLLPHADAHGDDGHDLLRGAGEERFVSLEQVAVE